MIGFALLHQLLLACIIGTMASDRHMHLMNRPLDGCRYVFLDLGSNIGMHSRFLFEPEKYPDQQYSTRVFDKYFPKDRKRSDICSVGFEPNPRHVKRLALLREYFRRKLFSAFWHHAGVEDKSGFIKFFHRNSTNDLAHNEWGFSTVPPNRHEPAVSVPTLRLSFYLSELVGKRLIPPPLHPSDPPSAVLGKMDIEGAEVAVLPDLIRTRTLCLFDMLTVEYHDKERKNEAKFASMVANMNDCKAKLYPFDVETYVLDTEEGRNSLQTLS